MPEAFGPVPEVIVGLSRREAEKVCALNKAALRR